MDTKKLLADIQKYEDLTAKGSDTMRLRKVLANDIMIEHLATIKALAQKPVPLNAGASIGSGAVNGSIISSTGWVTVGSTGRPSGQSTGAANGTGTITIGQPYSPAPASDDADTKASSGPVGDIIWSSNSVLQDLMSSMLTDDWSDDTIRELQKAVIVQATGRSYAELLEEILSGELDRNT